MTTKKKTILPNNLRKFREIRQLTQQEVGKILDLDHTAVSRHEASSRGLTDVLVEAYASLYKVKSAAIFVDMPSDDDSVPTTAKA